MSLRKLFSPQNYSMKTQILCIIILIDFLVLAIVLASLLINRELVSEILNFASNLLYQKVGYHCMQSTLIQYRQLVQTNFNISILLKQQDGQQLDVLNRLFIKEAHKFSNDQEFIFQIFQIVYQGKFTKQSQIVLKTDQIQLAYPQLDLMDLNYYKSALTKKDYNNFEDLTQSFYVSMPFQSFDKKVSLALYNHFQNEFSITKMNREDMKEFVYLDDRSIEMVLLIGKDGKLLMHNFNDQQDLDLFFYDTDKTGFDLDDWAQFQTVNYVSNCPNYQYLGHFCRYNKKYQSSFLICYKFVKQYNIYFAAIHNYEMYLAYNLENQQNVRDFITDIMNNIVYLMIFTQICLTIIIIMVISIIIKPLKIMISNSHYGKKLKHKDFKMFNNFTNLFSSLTLEKLQDANILFYSKLQYQQFVKSRLCKQIEEADEYCYNRQGSINKNNYTELVDSEASYYNEIIDTQRDSILETEQSYEY